MVVAGWWRGGEIEGREGGGERRCVVDAWCGARLRATKTSKREKKEKKKKAGELRREGELAVRWLVR